MGIITRLFLLIYALATATVVILAAGVCLHVIPNLFWQEQLKYIIGQPETLIILAIMLFFSFYFIGAAFSSNKKPIKTADEIVLKQGEPGQVKVAIEAIKRLTERAALTVTGVREAEVKVKTQEGDSPISIKMTIVLGQGYTAPVVSEMVIKTIDKAIFTALQISNVPIDISVKDFTNAVVERKQRVV